MELSHEDHIFKSSPSKLAKLLQVSEQLAENWHENEYNAILEHQLSVPLCGLPLRIKSTISLRQAFAEGASLQSLIFCKEWAKTNLRLVESTLPPSISVVLYYAAICAAQAQHNARITTVSADTLRLGLEWCLARPWLCPDLRTLFSNTIANIQAFAKPDDMSA